MKKLKITLLFVLAALLCTTAQSWAVTATLSPIEDTYVWLDDDGDGGNNFGGNSEMIVGEWDGGSPYGICRGYLMFDLSSIPAGQTITSATLHLSCKELYSAPVTTGAHFLSDDTWDEYTITWDSPPGAFNTTATDTITLAVGDNAWDVLSDVSTEYAGDKAYSVVMKLPVEGANIDGAWLYQDEHNVPAERPTLVVNYQAPDPVLKFQQLPLDGIFNGENDDYYGHDELSTAYSAYNFDVPVGEDPIPIGYQGCYMADDFADLVNTPVIKIKWWGSYLENYMDPGVQRFLIVFETDVPADQDNPYSHPGTVIQSEIVTRDVDGVLTAGEFSETPYSIGSPRCEDLYEYETVLANPFPEEANTVYWLKIVALVDVEPMFMQEILTSGLAPCELGKLTWADIVNIHPPLAQFPQQLTRWGWHNRDYTKRDPYASVPPAVVPGEWHVGTITTFANADLEVWHFQDDCVSGELFIQMDMTSEDFVVNQYNWFEEKYKHTWPLCPITAPVTGVDGPPAIEEFSKDLAFELYTEDGGPVDPDKDFGDAPEGGIAYPGTFSVTGIFPTCITVGTSTSYIQHTNFGAYFGPTVDFETDGNAGACPTAACFPPYDVDECFQDGDAGLIVPDSFTIDSALNVVTCTGIVPGIPLGQTCATAVWGQDIDIHVHNTMPNHEPYLDAYVNLLIDWNQDGKWSGSATGACTPPEHVLVNFVVPALYIGPLSGLNPPSFQIGPNSGYVWARFSITEAPVVVDWDGSGQFEDGETEDYLLLIDQEEPPDDIDFGDAPEVYPDGTVTSYPTTLANNGARHIIVPGIFMGTLIDPELDGQPTMPADGDDIDVLGDDEDGVTFTSPIIPGQPATVDVVASVPGLLFAWLDFDGNDTWSEASDQIFNGIALTAGLNNLTFTVPTTATPNTNTYARFRFTTVAGAALSYNGQALDGEVEDEVAFIDEEEDPYPDQRLKFQQLPLNGLNLGGNETYWGHDELSTAYRNPEMANGTVFEGCYMADDFADYEHSPVVRVKWWGSYLENEINQDHPVDRFLIAFERDIPAQGHPGDVDYIPSHPGEPILTQFVHLAQAGVLPGPGQYTETWLNSGGPPCNEALFEYEAILENPFPQDPNTVYWIKIVALVEMDPDLWNHIQNILNNQQPPMPLCEFLNLPYTQQQSLGFEAPPLTRWGWHNRDYTQFDQYASQPPAVVPGEHNPRTYIPTLPPITGWPDDQVWHFQDDAVSGDVLIDEAEPEMPFVDQPTWKEEYYRYSWPLCPNATQGVDGPDVFADEFGEEVYSKDLAFELWTLTECQRYNLSKVINGATDNVLNVGDITIWVNYVNANRVTPTIFAVVPTNPNYDTRYNFDTITVINSADIVQMVNYINANRVAPTIFARICP